MKLKKEKEKKKAGRAGLLARCQTLKPPPPPRAPKQYFSKPKIIAGSSFPFSEILPGGRGVGIRKTHPSRGCLGNADSDVRPCPVLGSHLGIQTYPFPKGTTLSQFLLDTQKDVPAKPLLFLT